MDWKNEFARLNLALSSKGFPSIFINKYIKRFVRRQKHKWAFICDCDGVLTDSHSTYSEAGKVFKDYGSYDTEMLEVLKFIGIPVVFFTSDKEGIRIHRSRIENHLKQELHYGKVDERIKAIEDLHNQGFKVSYVGDSITDITVGQKADKFYSPYNAPKFVKSHSSWHSKLCGGYGALGDIILNFLSRER